MSILANECPGGAILSKILLNLSEYQKATLEIWSSVI